MARPLTKPELLAPAGNLECLHAAVTAGADAVYLGLDEFNARRNAENFTLESLADACDYAHLRGVSIYVTMNIEILPDELDRAIDVAHRAWIAGADALIVQDIGLAAELHRLHPEIPIHASTQMNIHNAAGIAAAAQLGVSRVTLARELSLAEIAELAQLAQEFDMTIESFAHGALCVCYSGQCLMSSMIGGRSANRGLCAQACRLPYELVREDQDEPLPSSGEHLLSPRDLCTIDLIDDLAAAGVASLKIEGRMKSPDYVYAVVSVYREVLDGSGEANEGQRARLAEAFSRGFTTAYLEGQRGNEIMSYGRPNNRGVFAGRVTRVEGDVAHIAPEIQLHKDDVLEFWTNRGHFAATVANPTMRDGCVRVQVDKKTGKGDRVFRVRNAQMAFVDDALEPRIPVRGSIALRIGEPAFIEFEARGVTVEVHGDVVEPARTRAVGEQDVRDHVDRLGQTPFVLEELHIDLDDNVGIAFSKLHHLRADALSALQHQLIDVVDEGFEGGGQAKRGLTARRLEAPRPRTRRDAAQTARTQAGTSSLLAAHESPDRRPRTPHCTVAAWATNPACARAAKRAGADSIYVPLLNFRRGQAQLQGVRQEDPEQAGYPKQCISALPTVDHDPVYAEEGATRETTLSFDIWDYVREGKPVFADNLGDIVRALECGALVEVGPHIPVTNRATLQVLADWGVSKVWLSPELTLGQIANLANGSPVPLGLTVSGAQELMITEHCLLMSQGPCAQNCETCTRRSVAHRLHDRKGYDFPVVTDSLGRSHLYNGIELDAVPTLPDLLDMGFSSVMVDTTLMSKQKANAAVSRLVRALDLAQTQHQAVQRRPNTTTGHLFRGVS